MTAEAWTIMGTGAVIAAMLVGLITWWRTDMKDQFARLKADVKGGQARLEGRLLAVEREQARASGLLESLGLTGRVDPAPATGDCHGQRRPPSRAPNLTVRVPRGPAMATVTPPVSRALLREAKRLVEHEPAGVQLDLTR